MDFIPEYHWKALACTFLLKNYLFVMYLDVTVKDGKTYSK